mgnify:CR=1 FL=1
MQNHDICKLIEVIFKPPISNYLQMKISNNWLKDYIKTDLKSDKIEEDLQYELNFRRSLNVKNFPSLILKYKKELYPINIKYNDYKSMLEQINDMVENSYF